MPFGARKPKGHEASSCGLSRRWTPRNGSTYDAASSATRAPTSTEGRGSSSSIATFLRATARLHVLRRRDGIAARRELREQAVVGDELPHRQDRERRVVRR